LRLTSNISVQPAIQRIYFCEVKDIIEGKDQICKISKDQCCLIIDEFDSLFFQDLGSLGTVSVLIELFNNIVGFSGSELQDFNKKYLEDACSA
jgi:hypothetical protein